MLNRRAPAPDLRSRPHRPIVFAPDQSGRQKDRLRQEAARQRPLSVQQAAREDQRAAQPQAHGGVAEIMPVRTTKIAVTVPPSTSGGGIVQVLKENAFRKGLIIPNNTGVTIFVAFSPDDVSGIPIANGTTYTEQQGTVTIDAVYLRNAAIAAKQMNVYERVAVPQLAGK